MKKLLLFLFLWFLAWGTPFVFFPQLEDIPTLKDIFYLPEYLLGTGFLVLLGFFVEDRYRKKKRERDAFRRGYASGKGGVLDAPAEPGAERKSQAVIVVHAPLTGNASRFVVWIDGQWVGEAQPWLANEFVCEPGEHTVTVSMAWFRSRPVSVQTRPGSRTELKIGGSCGVILLKWFLPILACGVAEAAILAGLQWAGAFATPTPRWIFAIGVAVGGGYFLAASVLCRNYWAIFTLEPVTASPAQQCKPEPAASADRPRDPRLFDP